MYFFRVRLFKITLEHLFIALSVVSTIEFKAYLPAVETERIENTL
jgi:hypothetical protein